MATIPPHPSARLETLIGTVWGSSDDSDLKIWQAAHTWLDRHPGARSIVISQWAGGGWYAARHETAPLRNTLFVAGAHTKADDQQFQQALRHTRLLVCRLPALPENASAAERVELLGQELQRLLPADLVQQVLAGYIVAETDPQVAGWVMLRRRATD